MAARKPAPAPQKVKLRKNHGPKRKMFHCWTSTMRLAFAKCGVLTKYYNFESFQASCTARGVRSDVADLYEEFIRLPDRKAQDEYLKNISENAKKVAAAKAKKAAKMKKLAEKSVA